MSKYYRFLGLEENSFSKSQIRTQKQEQSPYAKAFKASAVTAGIRFLRHKFQSLAGCIPPTSLPFRTTDRYLERNR